MKGMLVEAEKRYPKSLKWVHQHLHGEWVDTNYLIRRAFLAGVKWAEAQRKEDRA